MASVINPFQIGPSMLLPLLGDQQVLGALCLGRRRGREPFTEVDLDMAAMFANQAALALELAHARADRDRLGLYEERTRIARDLHDHVIQQLFAAGLLLDGSVPLADAGLARRLNQAVNSIDDAIGQIRSSIFDLRTDEPASALRTRLRRVVADVEPGLGFSPELHIGGPIDGIAAAIADDVVACVREGLANVVRHAHATHVMVRIEASSDWVSVQLTDDGAGYEATATTRSSGLANLAQRAQSRGGSFALVASPRGGTDLHWKVPSSPIVPDRQ